MSDLSSQSAAEIASTTEYSTPPTQPPVLERLKRYQNAHSQWVTERDETEKKFNEEQRGGAALDAGLAKFQEPEKSPDATRYGELYHITSSIEHFDLDKADEYKQLLESVTAPQGEAENEKTSEEKYTKAEALFSRTFFDRGRPEDAIKILKANPNILHSPTVQGSISGYLDKSLNSASQYLSAADKSRQYLDELYDGVLSEKSPVPEELKEKIERKQNIVLGIKIQRDLVQNPIGTPEQHNKKREELLAKTNQKLKSAGNQEVTLHEGVSSGKVDSFKRKYKEIYGKDLSIGTDGYFQASLSLAEQAKDKSNSEKTRKTAEALAIGMAIVQPIERTKKETWQCSKDQTLTVLLTDLDHPEESSIQKLRANQELNSLFTSDNQLEYDFGFLKGQNEASVVYSTKVTEDQEAKQQAETKKLNEEKTKAEKLAQEAKAKAEAVTLEAWKIEQLQKFNTSDQNFPKKDRFSFFGIGFGGKVPDLDNAGRQLRNVVSSETDPAKKTFLLSIKF